MTKQLLLAGTALGGLAMAGPALAADIPVKAPPMVAPAFSWTGCYIGGHVGMGRGQKEWDDFSDGFVTQLFGGVATINQTILATAVPTNTVTTTATLSFSNTASISFSVTTTEASVSASATASFSFSESATFATTTISRSSTFSETVSATFTATGTSSGTVSSTNTASGTFNVPGDGTASGTFTVAQTTTFATSSFSATVTGTDSAIFTDTASLTKTATGTGTVAITFTVSATTLGATGTVTASKSVSIGTSGITVRSSKVDPISSVSDDSAGFLAGGQIGCDYQFAPKWVIGFEGSGSWAHLTGTDVVAFNTVATFDPVTGLPFPGITIPGQFANFFSRTDWLASATLKLGYSPWERWLFYSKGGAAWAGDRYSLTGQTCAGINISVTGLASCTGTSPFNFTAKETRFGWTTGLGIEHVFWNGFSWKLEYDYYDFGTKHVTFTDQLGNFSPGDARISQRINVIMFGLNYRFNFGKAPAPVQARY